jgi:hypothetical protein
MTIQRFIVENNGPNEEAVKMLFAEAIRYSSMNNIRKITLLVSVKGSFPDTVVGNFLGQKNSKKLCKGNSLLITDNISLNLDIPKNMSGFGAYGLVIGIYLSKHDLNALDSIRSAKAIAYLPWFEDEGKAWAATWCPKVWGISSWSVIPVSLPFFVEEELQRLTRIINLSTGLTHPSDKTAAQQIFKKLKSGGHTIHPENIRQWAIKNGWQPRHAEALSQLASKYCN